MAIRRRAHVRRSLFPVLALVFFAGAAIAQTDSTPPSCSLTETLAGPPKQFRITIQDADSGLASLSVTKAVNASFVLPPYAFGTKGPLPVIATRIDPFAAMDVILTSSDVAGNSGSCEFTDPALPVPTLSRWLLGALALALAAFGARKLL